MLDPAPDMETREITFTAASGEPYQRCDWNTGKPYYERLVVTDDACSLERLNGGASILKNHDPDRILGTIEKAWIEDGKVCVRARFRKNDPDADAVFRDIVDGTLKNVSIGYEISVSEPTVENGVEFCDVTRWSIFEVSVAVGVPADPTVGFYRNYQPTTQGERMMARDTDPNAEDPKDPKDPQEPEGGEPETPPEGEPENKPEGEPEEPENRE
ncbi:MAG: HK97 family phage prohead protease, partial [Thermoguttaceae bacterium]|nr:HK97 family phage prohead protease [Thermoguttaceae bacterium]